MSKFRTAAVALAAVAATASGSVLAAPQAQAATGEQAKYCKAAKSVQCSMYFARGVTAAPKSGAKNIQVWYLQKSLQQVNIPITVTVRMDAQTTKAIRAYQKSRKLNQTGIADAATRYALRKGFGNKLKPIVKASSGTTVKGGYSGACEASNYWQPQSTASGEWFNPNAMTAAHKTLPLGTKLKVTNKKTGKSVIVRINDRGPYVGGRCLDLSRASFAKIAPVSAGVAQVTYVQVK